VRKNEIKKPRQNPKSELKAKKKKNDDMQFKIAFH